MNLPTPEEEALITRLVEALTHEARKLSSLPDQGSSQAYTLGRISGLNKAIGVVLRAPD